jgi:hypothetical protein
MGSFRAALAATVACSLLTAPAVGADPTAGEQKARELVNHATEKSKAGDHKGAIELYLQAYQIAPLPILLSNVGSEYEKVNDAVGALKYFCKYLEAEPDGPMAGYATSHAKEMQGKLHVAVDDQTVCKPAKPGDTPPSGGSGDTTTTTTTGTGSATTVTDGGGGSAAVVETQPVATASSPGKLERIGGIAIAGLGAIGVGVGIYYGIQAQNDANAITNHCMHMTPCPAWPNNIKQLEADGTSDQNNQIAGLIVGGALVVGGAVVFYLGYRQGGAEPTTEHAMVTPVVAPGYEGFAYTGRF